MNLSTSLESIKGVGPRTADQLKKAGLGTVRDILEFLPRTYEDFSDVTPIDEITPGKRTIRATVEQVETKMVRRGLKLTTATLVDGSGKLRAIWFNQPYREAQFKNSKQEFYFSGEFEFSYNRYQLTNPNAEQVDTKRVSTDRIVPVYRSIKGLKSQIVRKLLVELRPLMTMLPETLPPEILKNEKLLGYSDSLLKLHFPETMGDVKAARERIGFEEVFQLLLASELNKQANQSLKGIKIAFNTAKAKQFTEQLPFALTDAQRRAAWDVFQDFEHESPMNRLLQGDVGSGKTVVAAFGGYIAAQSKLQTAFLAPTEILARQHAETLQTLLTPFGINVALLTGSVSTKSREPLLAMLRQGDIDIIVGTHALLEPSVTFHQLGFVVIDEQHRFGVAQRQKLLAKSRFMPHLLAMTATPIPRSLALTVYGELDLSIMNEKPKNRLPIITKIWQPTSRSALYKLIDEELEKGRQAYVICPLIDESTTNDKKSVEAEYKKLKNSIFGHRRIGLLHGRMKAQEKEQVMNDFATGSLDILVSTTVVEVGVDVPNATVMLIENADHYGLSQLHQLRGRVGRSEHQSYCYLLTSDTKKPSQRLREVERSNDGFYLAEVDLELRGPGEIYGRMQHGALNLQVAALADTRLIARAQKAAKWFVTSGQDLLHYKQLAHQVEYYQRVTTLN